MRWFSLKSERRKIDDTHEWERQRALYVSKREDINAEFTHFSGRKPYKRLPVWLNARGSLGL